MSYYNSLDSLTNDERLDKIKRIIDHDPKNMLAHQMFLYFGAKKGLSFFENQYKIWMKRFPKFAELPLAFGYALKQYNNQKAIDFFALAVKLNPKLPNVWNYLYLDAYFKFDSLGMEGYLKKGIQANPNDAKLAFLYLNLKKNFNQINYKDELLGFSKRFINDEYGAKALFTLAINAKDLEETEGYYKLLKLKYSPEKFRVSSDAMIGYFRILQDTNFDSAFHLVEEMSSLKVKYEKWDELRLVMVKLKNAKTLITQNKGKEALVLLNSIKVPYFAQSTLTILPKLKDKAFFLTSGIQVAYDSLLLDFSKKPSLKLYNSIESYTAKLNKDSVVMNADILSAIYANVKKATPFKLKNLNENDSVSLTSLKGNVVLLTYWYPKCGPCRNEIPHLENVMNKFSDKNIKYLGINIETAEDSLVMPIIKNLKYSFTPLTENKFRNKGNLDNMGAAPVNFLIDCNGNLVFKDFFILKNEEKDLELMINLLLTER